MDGDSVGCCSGGNCGGGNQQFALAGEDDVPRGGAMVTSMAMSVTAESSSLPAEMDLASLDLSHSEDDGSWTCAVCMDSIKLEEFAQVKGCDHTYCATCILRWAGTFKKDPWCPQCRLPFSMLYLYRQLDGSFNDYLVEESVCLLLCAVWFTPLTTYEEAEEPFPDYGDEFVDEEEAEEMRYVRLSNRRWGENGFVRGGRLEARVFANHSKGSGGGASGSSSGGKGGKGSAGNSSRSRLSGNANNAFTGGGSANHGGTSESGSANGEASGGGKPALGRRARRAKQRAALDGLA